MLDNTFRGMYRISFDNDDPYAGLIEQFVTRSFPRKLCGCGAILIDILADEILGTKQTRFGPKPSPEVTVAIREVIRRYVGMQLPIPFMVPWGSEKPDGSSIDVAELGAIRTLAALQEQVKKFYSFGLQFNIRLEDASAPYLFYTNQDAARANATRYTQSFCDLIEALELSFIKPVPESRMVSEAQFNAEADLILPHMIRYLRDNLGLANLRLLGWKGEIHLETIQFYLRQYEKMGIPENQRWEVLARYFSSALARHRLKIRGDDPEWEGQFIDLSFVQATPGTENIFGRRVYYRTLPLEYTSNHIAPWRAKGYLLIDNDNVVIPKLASFNDLPNNLNPNCILINSESKSVRVKADYILV